MRDDLAVDFDRLTEPELRQVVARLLNVVEELQGEVTALREENQRLRDEVARLKGLPSRPTYPARSPTRSCRDHSTERERHEPTPRQRRRTRDHLVIHRRATLERDSATLPPDAQFKGYVEVTGQDVLLRAENTLFRRAKWYSPPTRQTY